MLFKLSIGRYVDKWNFGGSTDFGGGWTTRVMFRRSVGEVIIGTSDHKNTKRIGDVGEGMYLCQCENKNVSFYI